MHNGLGETWSGSAASRGYNEGLVKKECTHCMTLSGKIERYKILKLNRHLFGK